jgi:hypothetical protein
MFSPAADSDPAEREKEILSSLIKRFIVDKEDKNQPSLGRFLIGNNSREPKDDYLELNRLKEVYPAFILANKNILLGPDLTDSEKQSFLNSVDKDWRTKGGRRTRNRRKNKKTKRRK